MPINASLYRSLKKTYGSKASDVYFGMEEEAKQGKRPSFLKGLRTAKHEGHVMGLGRKKKKAAK